MLAIVWLVLTISCTTHHSLTHLHAGSANGEDKNFTVASDMLDTEVWPSITAYIPQLLKNIKCLLVIPVSTDSVLFIATLPVCHSIFDDGFY